MQKKANLRHRYARKLAQQRILVLFAYFLEVKMIYYLPFCKKFKSASTIRCEACPSP